MIDTTKFKPGSFFLRKIHGPQGRLIAGLQAFTLGGSQWTHAGLILDNDELVQGEPHGAKLYPLSTLEHEEDLLVSDAPIQTWLSVRPTTKATPALEGSIRWAVVAEGRKLVGTPYSYLDYVALSAAEFKWPLAGWLRKRVNSSGHMICSALVDHAYQQAGIQLFDDGRFPGDVSPMALDVYDRQWEIHKTLQTYFSNGAQA
jgi:uncharacterized protein YycO